jgi:hypothetical protein
MCLYILEGNSDNDDEMDNSAFELNVLLTGQGPVLDELSECSVPVGSLMSSSKDSAIAGPSCIAPISLQLRES